MRIYDNRPSFYQWDRDQKVVHDFQVGDVVEFSSPNQKVALMVKAYKFGDEIVADVPNILLQSSYPITIYWMHLCSDCKYTREKFIINVKHRPKPAGYVYTETEILSYKALDDRITKLEKYGGGGSGEGISSSLVEEIVKDALEEAKNSGKFDGKDGVDGKDGYTPIKGVDYFDGKDGADGKTPIKGVGYFTDADKAELVTQVIAGLPVYNGEVVDE